jgi:hypothetical protein
MAVQAWDRPNRQTCCSFGSRFLQETFSNAAAVPSPRLLSLSGRLGESHSRPDSAPAWQAADDSAGLRPMVSQRSLSPAAFCGNGFWPVGRFAAMAPVISIAFLRNKSLTAHAKRFDKVDSETPW